MTPLGDKSRKGAYSVTGSLTDTGLIPVERGDHSEQAWNPKLISASRVNSFLQCGVAFKMHYVDGMPEQRSGSAALFGNVIHEALEKWTLDRKQDLVTLTAQAWMNQTRKHRKTQEFIQAYQGISVECMKAEQAARVSWEAKPMNRGKVSKAPRMTKDFKESAANQKLLKLIAHWLPKLTDSPWQFTERDPLPGLYDESLQVAAKYARKYGSSPSSVHTEFGFMVEWRDYILRGYIDAIDPLVAPTGELTGYLITDYKTYRAEASEMKDWRQGVMYDIAVRDLIHRGVLNLDPDLPRYIVYDYVRLLKRKDFAVTKKDWNQLDAELTLYTRAIDNDIFLPADKGANPDFCGYPENCCLRTRGEGVGCRGGIYNDDEEA